MWLKAYLDLSPDRAMWGNVADAIFATRVPNSEKNVDKKVRQNPFLQSWKTSCGAKTKIKPELKSLLDTAKTFQVRPEGLAFSRAILRDMPIWYHREAESGIRRMNHSDASECLRDKHGVRSVGDAEKFARCRTARGHQPRSNCACAKCEQARTDSGCEDPHSCYQKAHELLNKLPYKWDPRREQPEDYESQESGNPDDEGWIVFDKSITTNGPLANIFRIFTEGVVTNEVPDLRPDDSYATEETVATDGSCLNNGQDDASAGAGIYFEADDPRNKAIKLPQTLDQSNQTAELVAVKEA
ncbi:hypothetical protein B0H11DRAFT_1641344, partial [Mycena galericulata]